MLKLLAKVAIVVLVAFGGGIAPSAAASPESHIFPERLLLPDGFFPDGITIRGTTFYVGSMSTSAIYRGDIVTGRGSVWVPGDPSRPAFSVVGMEIDRYNRIWVAGGIAGDVRVIDADTGAVLATYQVVTGGEGFVNNLLVTRDAVYVNDSFNANLYVLPLGPHGALPAADAVHTVTMTGPAQTPEFNSGIVSAPDGRLLMAHDAGFLMLVDPDTGVSDLVDLGGHSIQGAHDIVRSGRTVYVIHNYPNKISVLSLNADFTRARLVREITSDALRVPSAAVLVGPWLYVVNARFDIPAGPTVDYDVVRLWA